MRRSFRHGAAVGGSSALVKGMLNPADKGGENQNSDPEGKRGMGRDPGRAAQKAVAIRDDRKRPFIGCHEWHGWQRGKKKK